MKRLLTLSTFLLLSIVTFASTEVNGIYYEFSETEATVVKGTNKYTGSVTIPASVTYGEQTYSVTSIGTDAFRSCSGLTSITIPNSVTSIGNYAFQNCSGLTSVTIPNSVTSIGRCAFWGCSELTSIEIPNSVTSIGSDAFYGCSGLTSVTIPNSVTSIGSYAFSGTAWYGNQPDGLVYAGKVAYRYKGTMPENTSITIKDGTLGIGGDAFYECSGLTSVTIPNSVTSIGEDAFKNCSGLTSITIGGNVTSIGSGTFSGCSGLTSITIGGNVTSIGSGTFSGCSGLTSITIPNSVETIENHTFADCSSLTSVTIGENVTSIGNQAFKNCNKLTHIYIPNKVTSIDAYAFCGCSGLNSITIGNNVTNIGESAFQGCWGLTYVTIPKSVKSIGHRAFLYCNDITSIYCNIESPSNIGEIFEKSYYSNVTLYVPYGTRDEYQRTDGWRNFTNIKENLYYTFSGTEATVVSGANKYTGDVIIPASVTNGNQNYSVTRIYQNAFYGCTGLTSVTIPNSVTSIGSQAFSSCSGLTSITIPNSVKIIGSQAFSSCSGLTSITISNSVKSIGSSVFYGCSGLTSIDIPNSVTSIGESAFSGCSGLTSVTIPNSVKFLGGNAFSGCTELESVDIPNSVIELGFNAFRGCAKITSITIPSNMLEIGSWAFYGCSGLASIYSYIENPTSNTGSNFDSSNYTNATLYVLKGKKNEYLATDGWKNFANIVEMEPTPEPSSDNTLAISNAETYAGKQIVLPIDMNNVASIQAFQFDLYLPEGVTIAKDEENEDMIDLTGRAAKSHTVAYSKQADGAIRMVCTSMSGATFKGNEGTIVNVTLDVAQSMTDGDYDIEIKNIELSDGTPYNPADIKATLTVKTYTPGDVDGTGTVSVNDAVCVINYILGEHNGNFIEPAADLDGNGEITVNDVVILINDYILGGNSQNSLDLNLEQVATADEDYLYINDINMKAGETREVEVYMNTNRTDIQGLQCDIYLPEGIEFVYEEDGEELYYADKGGRAAKSHSVAARIQPDGVLRVVETSTSGAKFKENDQAVFVFQIKAKDDIPAGNAEIKLGNVELSYGGAPINPSDRTSVVVIDGTPTGVDAVEANEASSSFVGKFIKDNQIIIMKNGKKYSVCGQEM